MIFGKIQCLLSFELILKVKNIKHTATLESNVLDQHLCGFFLTNWAMLFKSNKKMKGKQHKVVVKGFILIFFSIRKRVQQKTFAHPPPPPLLSKLC